MTKLPKAHDYSHVIISTMKDEGPYILDWLAHHIGLGFTHFVILTNDCSDRTDKILRNLEQHGLVTHKNNKEPHPRGIQKTAWKRAARLDAVRKARWIMALDVDEYLSLDFGDGTLRALHQAVGETANAISFVWQIFGNNGVETFKDQPLREQFQRSSHPLQAKPYLIRGFKTLHRNIFEDIGTHRPHKVRQADIKGKHWLTADGVAVDELYEKPYWCVWNNGFLYGGALGRVEHYALRSKEAFMIKMRRGFVNRTGKGPRASQNAFAYWQVFDWNIILPVANTQISSLTSAIKAELLSIDKIDRLHSQAVIWHQERIANIKAAAEFEDEFRAILNVNPKTRLDPHDPILLEGQAIPFLFSPDVLEKQARHSLIDPEFVHSYYQSLRSIEAIFK